MTHRVKKVGKITFPSGYLILGDPCYINDEVVAEAGVPVEGENQSMYTLAAAKAEATVYATYGREGQTKRLEIRYARQTGSGNTNRRVGEGIMDTAQVAVIDAGELNSGWKGEGYDDRRIYRHKTTGDTIQYKVDFAHYESPIPSRNGATMNELNATGEWEELPYPAELIDLSYNGLCHVHDNDDDVAILNDFAVVCGTGADGYYDIFEEHNESDEITAIIIKFR